MSAYTLITESLVSVRVCISEVWMRLLGRKFASCVVLLNFLLFVTTKYNKDSNHIPVHVSEIQILSHYFVRALVVSVFFGSNGDTQIAQRTAILVMLILEETEIPVVNKALKS